jgi:ABC-type multidrug transport system fused ATPase/permease subunit
MKNSKDSQPTSAAGLVTSYYLRHALKYPRWLAGLGISVPMTVLVNNYLPALIAADVLSKLSQHRYISGQIWQSFGTELMLYVGLLLVGIAFWRLVDFFMWRLEMNIQQDIAEEVFDHMLSRSADFHANNFSGSLVSQTNKLLGSYVRVADTTIYQSFPLVVGLVLTVIILAPRAPLFVLGLVTFTLLYISTAFIITKPVQQKSARFPDVIARERSDRRIWVAIRVRVYAEIHRYAAAAAAALNDGGSLSKKDRTPRPRLLIVRR